MIRFVKYEPHHLELFDPDFMMSGVNVSKENMKKAAGLDGFFSYTMTNLGKPVGVMGGFLMCQGVAEVWSVLSKEARKLPFGLHRQTKMLLELHEREYSLHRIQMQVLEGFEAGYRWAESLGFQEEGLLRSYGPNRENMWMMARINNG